MQSTTHSLDTQCRSDFPVLERKVRDDKALVYLDNAATTQKPIQVIDAITDYYKNHNSNIHRAVHALAEESTEAFEVTRSKVAKFLNVTNSEEIIFVRGTTEAINLVAYAWGRDNVQKGDIVVTTEYEHHSNIVPWQILTQETGAELRYVDIDKNGELMLEQLDEHLATGRVKLVAVSHVSNVLGTITDVKKVITKCKNAGSKILIDGAQADEKVASEIRSVLKKFSANGAVIVSDGEDDEMVIPVIQNIIPVISVQRVVMQVSRTIEHSYAVFGKFLKLVMYNPKYSKFFLGVPGILLLIGGIGAVTGYNAEIFAVLISILGGAFLIRAFDIDKAWANWAKPTPEGFTRMFTLITGLILIAASVPAGIASVSTVYTSGNVEISNLLTNEIVVGQFVSGMIPFLWIGLGTIFVGILFSNWLNRKLRHISDILRLVVLVALYPTVHQFTNILMFEESSFSLIVPLVAGFAVTAASATLLIRRYRKKGNKEVE